MRKDIMVDIETLGTGESSTIFQIAASSFSIETGEIYDSINLIGDIESYPYLSVDGSTLKWWLNTDKELLTNLLNSGNLTEGEMISLFNRWVKSQSHNIGHIYLWGNGILFDNAKLKKLSEDNVEKYPIYYRNDRDVRTLLELASMKSGMSEDSIKDSVSVENETKHDAIDDVTYQIRLAHKCYSILMGDK